MNRICLKAVLSLLFCFLSLVTFSRDLPNRIPSDAAVVLSIHSQSMGNALGLEQLNKFAFMKKINAALSQDTSGQNSVFNKLLQNPGEVGIDATQDSYAYIQIMDSIVSYSYLIALNNKDKFEAFVKEGIISRYGDKHIHTINGCKYYKADDLIILWTKDYAQLITMEAIEKEKDPYYNYYNYTDKDLSEYDALEQEKDREKKIKDGLANTLKALTSPSLKGLLSNNDNFKAFYAESFELGLWVNAGSFTSYYSSLLSPRSYNRAFNGMMSELDEIYRDNYMHAYVTLPKGEVQIRFRNYPSARMKELFGNVYGSPINPKFTEYIRGDSLMMLYGFSLDLTKTTMSTLEMYRQVFAANKEYGDKAVAYIDMLSIVVNFERLSKIAKGDFLLSMSGFKEYEREFLEYEYDEDYNRTATWVKRKEKSPMFTAMLTIGNMKDMQTFIASLEKLELLEKEEGKDYYVIKIDKRADHRVFLAIRDNILFISNDDYLATNDFNKPYNETERMNAHLQQNLKSNSIITYLNFDLLANAMQRDVFDKDSVSVLEWGEFRKTFSKLEMQGVKETGDYSETTLTLTMANTDRSSVVEILYYLDGLLQRKDERDRLRQERYDEIAPATAPEEEEYDYVEPVEDDK